MRCVFLRALKSVDIVPSNVRLPLRAWPALPQASFPSPHFTHQALGIAAASLDCAVHYSMERKSFGQPICGLYAIQVD